MLNRIFIVLILFCLSASIGWAQTGRICVLPSGRTVELPVQNFNGNEYASLNILSKMLFPGSYVHAIRHEIHLKNERIRCAPSSFIINIENGLESRTGQMSLPSITLSGETHVPLKPFLSTLHTMNLYRFAQDSQQRFVLGYPGSEEKPAVIVQKAIYPAQAQHISREVLAATYLPEAAAQGIVKERIRSVQQILNDEQSQQEKTPVENTKGIDKQELIQEEPTHHSAPVIAQEKAETDKSSIQQDNQGVIDQGDKKNNSLSIPNGSNEISDDFSAPTIVPGHYRKPSGLMIRKDDLLVRSGWDEAPRPDTMQPWPQSASPYLASLTAAAGISGIEQRSIIRIHLRKKDNAAEMHFKFNQPIITYQKPEAGGREVIVRFPETLNAVENFAELMDGDPLISIKTERTKALIIYKLRFRLEVNAARMRRLSEKELALDIDFIPKVKNETPQAATIAADKKKWELDVLVLDPGHGGEDAGALSINGHKEKDITLAIAKKVKEYLHEILPATRVIMTRTDDTFIELYRRGQIANQYKGKLFISIHCNSMPTKPHPAHGCESYILRPGRNSEAIRVAEKENSSIRLEKQPDSYGDVSEEKLIIATMAQAAFVKYSERFATMLQKETSKNTGMYNRGVNQAGFLVLVGASMPNLLFETGFLSNAEDEKLLISEKGQNKIAEGIARAIKRYSEEYISAPE
jgi:N-acetylmuramoyl-L-alanine amidase